MSRSQAAKRRILQGVGANALGQAVNVIIQLVGLPVFLAVWGVELYGEWLVLSSLTAFLALSDVGFASAAANEMTIRVAQDDRKGAWGVYQSMWALLGGGGLAILTAILLTVWWSPVVGWLPLQSVSVVTAKQVLTLLAVHVFASQLTTVVYAGFRCDGNYAFGQSISAITRLCEFVGQMIVVIATGSLVGTALAALCVRLIAGVITFVLLKRKSAWLKWGFGQVSWLEIHRLLAPALAFVGMPLGHALRNQGIVQVIAATLGPAAVAIFSAHRAIANVAAQLVTALINSVWPEFSTAFGANDVTLMRKLHRKACQYSVWFSSLVCLLVTVAAPVLIPVWTSGRISCDYELLLVLLLANLLGSMWRTSSIVHVATNRHQFLAVVHVLSQLAVCLVALGVVRISGLTGIAVVLLCADALLATVVVSRSLRIVEESLSDFALALFGPRESMPRAARKVRDA